MNSMQISDEGVALIHGEQGVEQRHQEDRILRNLLGTMAVDGYAYDVRDISRITKIPVSEILRRNDEIQNSSQ